MFGSVGFASLVAAIDFEIEASNTRGALVFGIAVGFALLGSVGFADIGFHVVNIETSFAFVSVGGLFFTVDGGVELAFFAGIFPVISVASITFVSGWVEISTVSCGRWQALSVIEIEVVLTVSALI